MALAVSLTNDTPRKMQHPRFLTSSMFWRTLVIAWAGALYWLSSQSALPTPASFDSVDKFEHTAYFAIGGVCFLLSLRFASLARTTTVAVVSTVLFCAIVGLLDEWHQTFTPGRSGGDVWDWTADTLGGFIGAYAALLVQRWLTSAETTTSTAR